MSFYQKHRPAEFKDVIGNQAQVASLQELLSKKGGPHAFLFVAPPGCGKTTLARICAKFLGAGELSTQEYNSANNRGIDTAREVIEKMRFVPSDGDATVFIIDECFHKDTRVITKRGEVPIDSITPGTLVLTANGFQPVKKKIVNRVPLGRLCKITLSNGTTLHTTIDHPIFTQRGWIFAKDLREGDLNFPVFSGIMESMENSKNEKEIRKNLRSLWSPVFRGLAKGNYLLKSLFTEIEQIKETPPGEKMPLVWRLISSIRNSKLLFTVMRGLSPELQPIVEGIPVNPRASTATSRILDGGKTHKKWYHFLTQNEKEQPKQESRNSEKDNTDPRTEWDEPFHSPGGKRDILKTAIDISGRSGMGNGESNPNQKGDARGPLLLQGRPFTSNPEDSNRSRWGFSQLRKNEKIGSEENRMSQAIRVVSSEIYQSGSNVGAFKDCIGSKDLARGYVEYYDLTMATHHSYFAGGVLVHNCHKTTNDWQNAMLKPLEDTPDHVYFFLCTTDPQKLIPAIKTRCTEIKLSAMGKPDLLLLLRKVNRAENLSVDKEILEEIAELADGSPRRALVTLERLASLESPEDRKALLEAGAPDPEDAEVIALCRALLSSKSWGDVAGLLKTLPMDDPEKIRYAVLGYMSSVLLSGKQNNRAALASEFFAEPFYNSGKAGVVLASYQTMFSE